MNAIERAQLCDSACAALHHGESRLKNLPGLIEKIIDTKAWEERETRPGKIVKLKSLLELVTLPFDEGWGEEPSKIASLLNDHPTILTKWREAMKGEPGRKPQSVDNVNALDTPKGNSKAYTLSRLEKQHKTLFERVCNGELSANAAAIEAGFRKKDTPDEAAIKAFRKADNRLNVIKAIIAELEPHEACVVIDSIGDWCEAYAKAE